MSWKIEKYLVFKTVLYPFLQVNIIMNEIYKKIINCLSTRNQAEKQETSIGSCEVNEWSNILAQTNSAVESFTDVNEIGKRPRKQFGVERRRKEELNKKKAVDSSTVQHHRHTHHHYHHKSSLCISFSRSS